MLIALFIIYRFIAKVFIDHKFICEKTGKSKKIAKLNAINEAIDQLDIEGQVRPNEKMPVFRVT